MYIDTIGLNLKYKLKREIAEQEAAAIIRNFFSEWASAQTRWFYTNNSRLHVTQQDNQTRCVPIS